MYVFYDEVNESNIIKEFKNLLHVSKWETTLDDEFTFLFMNKTKLDDLPPNRTLISYKWVL